MVMLLACVRSGMGIIARRLADCPLRLIYDPQGRCIPIGFLPPVSRQMRGLRHRGEMLLQCTEADCVGRREGVFCLNHKHY
ncbi:hypothetical protein [Komagataeibacter saccharivorans]|uniref:hypothetical protein n=1 Tax=Komagataeibacter saccharivorans TaxID=265959 RepID=UPI0010503E32|nr:hypothetical protein [Komagataeibacter saccharivorans]